MRLNQNSPVCFASWPSEVTMISVSISVAELLLSADHGVSTAKRSMCVIDVKRWSCGENLRSVTSNSLQSSDDF